MHVIAGSSSGSSSRSGSGSFSGSSSGSSSGSGSGDETDEFRNELIQNMKLVAKDDDSTKDQDLADSLQNVKDGIVFKANEVKSQKRWTKQVTEIIESYVKKARKVNSHIRDMQQNVRVLFRKKKQIENMIVQRKLEKKLKIANMDLQTIQAALTNTKKKEGAFTKSKGDIKSTIGAMESELQKLRGGAGESSSSGESSDSGSSSSSSGSSSGSGSGSSGSRGSSSNGSSSRSGSSGSSSRSGSSGSSGSSSRSGSSSSESSSR